ncbi:DUF6168 family protein [Seonamhaeicola marinus]|uniref:DUF4293 family protein n=1 Tax=Seonamhaeicola marinus TaxID=1912246 RepID=A0A5D0HS86_9FLAO|nr:DUF6168 family protein [Seonamhaeicola marinus]TYA74105.1 hypothetical protein FUA24_12220 [Seonamhaeicola marinus]
MTLKQVVLKSLVLFFIAAVIFLIHFGLNSVFGSPVDFYELVYAYCMNLLMAYIVIYLLFFLKNKLKDQLGFIFMVASLLKFGAFFILFYPTYNSDGDLSRLEFLTFFIPYAVCLVVECVILSKILASLDAYK